MNRIILALLSMVLLAAHASAQQAQMDSVRSLLDHHKAQDAERVRLLCEAARLDAWIDPFNGERVADQAVTLARRLKDPTLVAVSLITKAGLHQNTWARDDQKALIDEAFTLSPTMGSIRERARALSVRDMNESWQGRVDDTRPLQHEALALARKAGDRVQEAWCLYNLGFALLGPDRQASDSLLLLSKRIMDAHGNLGERSFVDMWQGIIQLNDGQPARALALSEEALALALKGGSTMSAGNCYVMVGNCQQALGQYPAAIASQRETEKLLGAIGYREGVWMAVGNIGNILQEMGDHLQALPYLETSLGIAQELGLPGRMVSSLNGLAISNLALGDPAKALAHAEEALPHCEDERAVMGDQDVQYNFVQTYLNIGKAKARLNDHQGALQAFESAMAAALKGGLQSELAMAWINAADVIATASDNDLIKAGISPGTRFHKAFTLYRDALGAANENGWLIEQRDALKGLTDLSERSGDNRAALRYLKEYLVVKDTLLNADKSKAVANLQIQYETEKKEQQIVLLGKDKEVQAKEIQKQKLVRNGFIGGFLLVALFASVFLFQRNRIGKEKKRSEDLLLNILPAEVAEELKAKGEADAKQIDQVTVLFTDFKGFTAMSEKLTAKELVADIHECFSAFDRIMAKHGIEKIKTIGDAYMAAGGLPTPNTTHALDVVKAALEIRDFIAEGKAHKLAAGLPFFEIRIGIHTGPVVAGIVGVKKFAYDIWGDTVNTASRMESSGEVGQVNISESTYALVKNETGLTFTSRGKVQAKGKGEMEMYFVEQD